jgi:hypothetical protein
MIEEVPEDMIGTSVTLAATHLFNVNTANQVQINERDLDIFVRLVMQLLYLSQRARPDIRPAVSFLSTRVQHQCKDDYKKLA